MRSLLKTAGSLALAFFSVTLASPAGACSQCLCGSPTPPGFLLNDLAGRLQYGLEDRYLSKSNGLEDVAGEERQIEHRISGFVMYRPVTQLGLQARVPYLFKKNTEAAVGEDEVITHTHGVGDAEVLVRLDVLRFGNTVTRSGTVGMVAGLVAPTGSSDVRDDSGERLEAHLQPGTGAWSESAGLAIDGLFRSAAVSASVLGRFNGTNQYGFHYGKALLFNAGYARSLGGSWQAALELNGRSAARDETEDGSRDENSGGSLLYASPSVRWSGLGPAAVDLLVQIPIAKSLNGEQDENVVGRLAVTILGR
jgi:hypothetical protein